MTNREPNPAYGLMKHEHPPEAYHMASGKDCINDPTLEQTDVLPGFQPTDNMGLGSSRQHFERHNLGIQLGQYESSRLLESRVRY